MIAAPAQSSTEYSYWRHPAGEVLQWAGPFTRVSVSEILPPRSDRAPGIEGAVVARFFPDVEDITGGVGI